MTVTSVNIGGASVYIYDANKTQTIAAPSTPATGDIVDITTEPANAIQGTRIAGSTTYTVKLAHVGIDSVNGGLMLTALSAARSHTTAGSAVGIKITHTVPAYALGVAVFINDYLACIMPQKPSSRAANTSSSRVIPIYYTGVANALTATEATAIAGTGTCYGITRVALPDTTEDTKFTPEKQTVEITPAHSDNFNVVTGITGSIAGSFYNYNNIADAIIEGALYTLEGGNNITFIGFKQACLFRARPMEFIVPSATANSSDTYLFLCGEMESTSSDKTWGKATKPSRPFTAKNVPDNCSKGVETITRELFS